jgi:hypothetical protein
MKRILLASLAVVALAFAIVRSADAQGVVPSDFFRGSGFACAFNGCRVDLGTGATDYLYSDGFGVVAPGTFTGQGITNVNTFKFTTVNGLVTCASGTEGAIYLLSGTGRTGTGARSRLCFCTSDGAASPAYAWQNLISGTVGTASTCNP